MSKYSAIPPAERLPDWLRRPIGNASELERVQGLVKQNRLHTICEEGRCPNRGECYAAGTATFLLGGSICTRSCAFCQVDKGQAPMPVDAAEAERVADAGQTLELINQPGQRFGEAAQWSAANAGNVGVAEIICRNSGHGHQGTTAEWPVD